MSSGAWLPDKNRPAHKKLWLQRTAQEIKPLLPASRDELIKRTGYTRNTLDAVLGALRKVETVYTVVAGENISYEIKEQE